MSSRFEMLPFQIFLPAPGFLFIVSIIYLFTWLVFNQVFKGVLGCQQGDLNPKLTDGEKQHVGYKTGI